MEGGSSPKSADSHPVTVTATGAHRGLVANDLIKRLLAGKAGGNAASAQGKAAGNPTELLDQLRDLMQTASHPPRQRC